MNLFDTVALAGRRYEPQSVPRSGSRRFSLGDVLEAFNRHAIFELTPVAGDVVGPTKRPDPVRKIKVSLLDDGISAIHSTTSDWFEVFRTPPTGDVSKVRIVAHGTNGQKLGEIRMLVGQRTFAHYFEEDPILEEIQRRST